MDREYAFLFIIILLKGDAFWFHLLLNQGNQAITGYRISGKKNTGILDQDIFHLGKNLLVKILTHQRPKLWRMEEDAYFSILVN